MLSSKVIIKFLIIMKKHGYIVEFEYVDDHISKKNIVELNLKLNKCGLLAIILMSGSNRFNHGLQGASSLQTVWLYYVIIDHEEALFMILCFHR